MDDAMTRRANTIFGNGLLSEESSRCRLELALPTGRRESVAVPTWPGAAKAGAQVVHIWCTFGAQTNGQTILAGSCWYRPVRR